MACYKTFLIFFWICLYDDLEEKIGTEQILRSVIETMFKYWADDESLVNGYRKKYFIHTIGKRNFIRFVIQGCKTLRIGKAFANY